MSADLPISVALDRRVDEVVQLVMWTGWRHLAKADVLRLVAEVRAEAFEEAAKIAESAKADMEWNWDHCFKFAGRIAAALRAAAPGGERT